MTTPRTLVELLRSGAAERPGEVAIHFLHDAEEAGEVRWGALLDGCEAKARALRRRGLAPGDRMLLALPTGLPFVESLFGALLVGAVPVPVAPPPSLRGPSLGPHRERLANLAVDCEAVATATTGPVADAIGDALVAALPQHQLWTTFEDDGPHGASGTASPDDLALLQYTSGSTQRPKAVELTHDNLIANVAAIEKALFHEGARVVSWLPLYHDMGLIGTLLTSLHARVPLTLMPPQAFARQPASWLRAVAEHRATVTAAPNFAFRYCAEVIADDEVDGLDLSCVRAILNGAEPIDLCAVEAFTRRFGASGLPPDVVRPVYGLAESAVAVTFADPGPIVVDEVDAELLERRGEARPASSGDRRRSILSVGRAIPGQEVRIVDRSGNPVPDRHTGEVAVRGPSVMRGYHRRPEDTSRALRGGWLHTGDEGYLADGQLYLTGRLEDLIIRHGRNYHPQDLEELTREAAELGHGAVVAFAWQRESVTEVIVVAEASRAKRSSGGLVERQIRERLHDAFLFAPDRVLLVPRGAVPRTTSGKVRRRECQRLYREGLLAGAPKRIREKLGGSQVASEEGSDARSGA